MSTTLQRTYRNLRLGIAGTVVLIGVAVAIISVKEGILVSVSAYYYTPARNVLVGALITASFAMLALSGQGIQRVLLDAAALFAPIIALVPTLLAPGRVPGTPYRCGPGLTCVPDAVLPEVELGVWTYLVFGTLVLVVAIVVASVRVAREGRVVVRTVAPSFAIAFVVLISVLLGWLLAPDVFLASAHLVSAVIFFGLIAAVAVANAFDPVDPRERRPPRWLRVGYWIVAAALVVDLAAIIAVVGFGLTLEVTPSPLFVGEAIALALFVAFWVLQSVQKWNADDPRVLVAQDLPAKSR
ncbi:hypothetical protein N1027_17855 [Herbiconiux sp. CPCC 205763]|uniref:Uncharacterized protein n=1 Tax=Herbiconiux aconitum TaxID=2970913 RepID=A0ABT2GXG7_9MICO|nr:hypothetical protein [Herbiconiux aconitum]MCS5720000.1 hypothetical protein [Herbiconiux aconitum]